MFINDDHLQAPPTVLSLVRNMSPISVETSCDEILQRFLVDPGIYALPVVDAEYRPVALVDRRRFIEFFTKPFSREIFGRIGVFEFLQSKHYPIVEPIIVDDSCSVEDVARIIIGAGMEHMVTGFLVAHERKYLGVANGHDLLNLITQRKQAELYYLAHYDSLTGIPNRMLLGDRLSQACLDAERKGHLVALLFIDVDRFKQINDSLGHAFGDSVLQAVVSRLKQSARKSDTVARIGGDEFLLLMEDTSPGDADLVARRMVDSMRAPVELMGHSLVVTVSVGIAIYPTDDGDISRLLAKADAAMYAAKASGRNGFCAYTADGANFNPTTLSLENELRRGIERDELRLLFQPQVDLQSEEISGVEALVRWEHPSRGLLAPIEFITLAEESGLIVQLGEWVLREACCRLAEWCAQGKRPLRMSINISAVQFRQNDFLAILESALQDSGVDPCLIELELTESVLMHNFDDVLNTLWQIKALGISLAIDDFGTGYSSLNYLRRFPIDRLKIDQSFVRDIEHTPANESITRAIIALANSLSLDIVAEGIEKIEEKELLERLGCPQGQGYYFSRPVAGERILASLAEAASSPNEQASRCA